LTASSLRVRLEAGGMDVRPIRGGRASAITRGNALVVRLLQQRFKATGSDLWSRPDGSEHQSAPGGDEKAARPPTVRLTVLDPNSGAFRPVDRRPPMPRRTGHPPVQCPANQGVSSDYDLLPYLSMRCLYSTGHLPD